MKLLVTALLAAGIAMPAFAQDKTPAAVAPAAAAAPAEAPFAEMPKHPCNQPTIPGRNVTVAQDKQFRVDVDAYRSCLVAFSAQMQAEANARIKAANASVEEYNGYVKRVNDAVAQAEKEDAADAKARKEMEKNAKNAKDFKKKDSPANK